VLAKTKPPATSSCLRQVFTDRGDAVPQTRSSAVRLAPGWASVQCCRHAYVTVDVMTPDGLGIHLRQPAMLKYLFGLRGPPVNGTPFFERLTPEDERTVTDEAERAHNNETEMIINEKLWQGEEAKRQQRRRRAKRT
jgi:hypothetical protein